MAKSFKEIGKKAEALIEQGREADQRVQSCQDRVASSNDRVAAARRQLAAASETDEDGYPIGDVAYARAQLAMAENQLAASQRALASAREDADRVRQQKNAHVKEIEKHNQASRSNLQKLRQLRSDAFGADSAALTDGMVQRLNEAEDTKVALLRSMGIDATPAYVAVDVGAAVDLGWRGGNFATLDTSGQVQGYQGRGSKDISTDDAAVTIGGGVQSIGVVGGEVAYKSDILSNTEEKGAVRTLKKSDQQRYQDGLTYIDNMIDAYRHNLREKGISDEDVIEGNLAIIRANLLRVLSEDIQNGTFVLDRLADPEFDKLADRIMGECITHSSEYLISDEQRETIRKGIQNGVATEKEIRQIGHEVREKYDQLILEKHREIDEIRKEQFALAQELKYAKSEDEKENIELRRRILMERENCFSEKYNSAAMMRTILSQYRDIGPSGKTDIQTYQRSVFDVGSAAVIKAIDNVREYIPTDWVHRSNEKPIMAKHVSRGYFSTGSSSDIVALSGNSKHMESCAFHEMGHRFENLFPEILKIEKQFYDRRTNGEKLSWLGPGYGRSEVTRVDHFISPYMGKDYGGIGYELLSMGMEGMFCETFNISRDAEYEDLILGILVAI